MIDKFGHLNDLVIGRGPRKPIFHHLFADRRVADKCTDINGNVAFELGEVIFDRERRIAVRAHKHSCYALRDLIGGGSFTDKAGFRMVVYVDKTGCKHEPACVDHVIGG